MNEAKFQACPFCGSEPTITDTGTHNGIRWLVRCDNALCGVNPYARSMNHDRALAIWNQRAGDREPAKSKTPEPSTLASATCYAADRVYGRATGIHDVLEGRGRHENPYPPGSEKAIGWTEGYNEINPPDE